MAKVNNLPASAYAKPHTMSGAPVVPSTNPGIPPNRSKADTINMSVGNISKAAGNETVKTSGTVTRGNGAAIKGITARGPMA